MFGLFKKRVPSIPSGAVTRNLRGDSWHIELDLTPQIVSLSIPEERTWRQDELAPTCAALKERSYSTTGFVSASMLALKAKLFDDSLYAAADLAMQPAKAKLLAQIVKAAPLLAAAARLGGVDAPDSPDVESVIMKFLGDELHSKPLGFYTWSEELRRIFQQDRLLQQRLEPHDIESVKAALDAEPTAKAAYLAHLEIIGRLTNPPSAETDLLSGGACFFPPSRSHESDLVERLYGTRVIPNGFSLVDEMINRTRDGSLKLLPTEAAGWYDFQTWALEPLVVPERMPEAARLKMDHRYKKQLEDLFKATQALTRETHVKQLEILEIGAALRSGFGWKDPRPVVNVEPELTVEPLRSYYDRRALGYEFVRRVLETIGPLRSMRAITASGPSGRTLDEELEAMTALFRGAAAVAGHELGIESAFGPEAARFREWARNPDVSDDVRMMAPIFYDVGRGKTKVWAILGWSTRLLNMSFATRPNAHVRQGWPRIEWRPAYEFIAYPVFAETYVSRLLDRDEFRAHCDRYKTTKEILQHL